MAKNSPQRRNAIYEKAKQDRPAIVSTMSLEIWRREKQKVLRKSWLVWKCEFIQGGLLRSAWRSDKLVRADCWEPSLRFGHPAAAFSMSSHLHFHSAIHLPSPDPGLFWGGVFSTLLCVQPWWANNECVWTSVSSHIYCTRFNQRSNDNLLSHNPWSYPNPEAEWSPPGGGWWVIDSHTFFLRIFLSFG